MTCDHLSKGATSTKKQSGGDSLLWQVEEIDDATSESTETQSRIKSIRSRGGEEPIVVSRGDYVMVERTANSTKAETTNVAADNVYSELVNESSNTNYSADDASSMSASTELFCAQIKAIWSDMNNNDKLMASVKLFYKADQLKCELEEADRKKLEQNELVCIDQEPYQNLDVDSIKSKCSILNFDNYEK